MPPMTSPRLALIAQAALLGCFITVTSTGIEGRTILSLYAVRSIESATQACNYGVTVTLKTGQRICVIESLPAIEKALATQKSCEGR